MEPSGAPTQWLTLSLRSAVGGTLMGLANLVPGISGGTMLLAAGVYPRFINAIAELSTFRFRLHSVLVLFWVITAAAVGIFSFAGPIKGLVVYHRWIMYSLFIGLTLGGVPMVWKMAGHKTRSVFWGGVAGFSAMAALAVLQNHGQVHSGAGSSNMVLLALAGLAGASAMILPGVSGGYLLLVLGQYVPILAAVDAVKEALRSGTPAAALVPGIQVLLPVTIGVVLGIVGVSNALRWLLTRYQKATLGVLLGLLLGAVVGLWPFQKPVQPVFGTTVIKGRLVTEQNRQDFSEEDFPTEFFRPSAEQGVGAVGVMLLGTCATLLVARLGRDGSSAQP